MTKLREKYGLFTAIAMVIGSVIGSGVFFKAESINRITHPNAMCGILAWIIGGTLMLLCLLSFALIVTEYGSAGGLTGISKRAVGESFSYFTGWFMATVYYPTLVSVLAWLSARYTLLFFGMEDYSGGLCMLLSCIYLVISFAQNALFPDFSGKFQIVTTIAKLTPLVLMIVLGIIKGSASGILAENMLNNGGRGAASSGLFPAVVASLFAYEGWISATSIGAELKNSRRNLPFALIIGGVLVSAVYVLYYMGIMGAVPAEVLINYGADGIKTAFAAVLGNTAAALLSAFVAISCMGALNGTMMGCGRAMYEVSLSGNGPAPKLFSQLMPSCGMPVASFVIGLVFGIIWLFFLFGAQISETPLFSVFSFDSSELPVVTIYALYIPIFVSFIKKKKTLKSILVVALGICACVFTIICGIIAHGRDVVDYLFVLAAIMLAGAIFKK